MKPALVRHAAIFAGAFVLLLLIGAITTEGGWAEYDQRRFHLPLANQFLAQGFALDYPSTSATTPGTHLIVAGIAHLFGVETLGAGSPLVRLLFCLAGALTLTLAIGYVQAICRHLPAALAFGFAVFSTSYFLRPSLYLVTEGFAYLGYTIALGLLLFRSHSAPSGAVFALAGSLMVLSRQIFLPVVLAYGFHALPIRRARFFADYPGIALVIAIPALAFLPFALAWGGLVPPEFARHETAGLTWSVLTHNLTLAGIFAAPFVVLTRADQRILRDGRIIIAALIAALAVWYLIPSDPGGGGGRTNSAVWLISGRSPLLLGQPVLLLPPITLGCLAIAYHLRAAYLAGRWPVEWIMFGLYSLALMGQAAVWQRYVEALLIVTLSVSTAFVLAPRRSGLVLFIGAFALYFALSLAAMTGLMEI